MDWNSLNPNQGSIFQKVQMEAIMTGTESRSCAFFLTSATALSGQQRQALGVSFYRGGEAAEEQSTNGTFKMTQ